MIPCYCPLRQNIVLLLLAVASAVSLAEPAHMPIGVTTSLSGPDAVYGQGLLRGIQLATDRVNALGGVDGRQIDLLTLDDGGVPARAASNTRDLLQRRVLAITGVFGSGPTAAVAGVLAQAGQDFYSAPLVGPASSADVLRDPPRRGVFHLRASTLDQMSAAIFHLDTIGLTRFSVLAQDSELGDSGLNSVSVELMRLAMTPVSSARIRGGESVAGIRAALKSLCTAEPQAVILAVDATLAVAAVAAGRAEHCNSQYVVFSEAGASLSSKGGEPSAGQVPVTGLLVTQVVPSPGNRAHPLVAEYHRALSANRLTGSANQPSYPSLEGYQAMRVVIEALRQCNKDPSSVCMQQTLMSRSFEMPWGRVEFGATQRQASPFVETTLLDGRGRFLR